MIRPLPVLRHTPGRITPEELARSIGGCSLNVGSSSVRLPGDSLNLDISPKPNVDVVGDAHDLSLFRDGTFDLVVLCAVLQLCRDPRLALEEAVRVLKPGGVLYVDAPFIQQVCEDGPDLFRFTRNGLLSLCDGLVEVERCEVSLAGASAFGFYVQALVDVGPRWVSFALRMAASALCAPLSLTHFNRSSSVAGAHWLIGRKP